MYLLPGEGGGALTRGLPRRSLSIRQTAQARTVARINGVARYRKYRALSEQIARTMPKGARPKQYLSPLSFPQFVDKSNIQESLNLYYDKSLEYDAVFCLFSMFVRQVNN